MLLVGPNPKPKLLVGRFLGENIPPPGPRDPEPITVEFLVLLFTLIFELLTFDLRAPIRLPLFKDEFPTPFRKEL